MSGYIPTDDEVETAFMSFAFDLENQHPGSYEEAPEFASIHGAAEGFQRYKKRIQADAWEEGYRDGHSDGLSDGHPLFNDREPEENPYREANDD